MNAYPMQSRAKNKITKPSKKLTLLATPEPKPTIHTTVAQAMQKPNWRRSMSDEYNSQISNLHVRFGSTKATSTCNCDKMDTYAKVFTWWYSFMYKSKWVVCGLKHEYEVDYAETFSPFVKTLTIRLVLQLVVSRSWVIKQLDVNNAFLQGTLTDKVYVSQPPAALIMFSHVMFSASRKRFIYGLKQAPRT